jgi:hypothetical protein
MMFLPLLIVTAASLQSTKAFAWGDLGQEVVCEIAFQELTPSARAPGPSGGGGPASGRGSPTAYRLVAAIAERRVAKVDSLDTATAYAVGQQRAQRRGSRIR